MRKYLLAAVAATALATPAVARDQSWYAGIEGGLLIVEDTDFDYRAYPTTLVPNPVRINNAFTIDHNNGIDADVIAGYDFGAFRAEGELGYKRASIDTLVANTSTLAGGGVFNSDGNVRVWSAMANLLLDFGDDNGWSGYVGGGAGLASVRYSLDAPGGTIGNGSDTDKSIAWQLIAGVRYAISSNVDLGVKYRFFNAPRLNFSDAQFGNIDAKFRSHSLLASLIFNFAPPPPPPPPPVVIAPPPPPPPATQTCPDGSVILATEVCPAAPVYVPPPPPPAPERG